MKNLFLISWYCIFGILGLSSQDNLSLQLAVDSDRNGVVNFEKDDYNEDFWNQERGAIFFYNNDSDANNHTPDCFDDKINGAEDLQDLAIIKLQQNTNLPKNSKILLSLNSGAEDKVNIFLKKGQSYTIIENFPFTIEISSLKKSNLEFRIEAKSYTTNKWNGIVNVTTALQIPNFNTSDTVSLKVAPFILLPNTQPVETMYIRSYPGKNDAMIQQLRSVLGKSKVNLEIVPSNLYPYNQIWMQDTMEIGYTQGPQHWFHVVLPANRNRSLDNWSHDYLLGKNYGWFRHSSYRHQFARGGGQNGWLDWYGNLEVSPAIEGYPFGRIYYGSNGVNSLNPEILDMLDRQNVQRPLVKLDTGWLLIKHVDEILSFIPTTDKNTSHKALVPSTKVMIDLLKKWQKQGKGNKKILEKNGKGWTVNSLLNNKSLMSYNNNLQKRINSLYETAKKEFGLKELVYIPALFQNGESLIPNMVNSVVVNGNLLMANPNGPKEGSNDLIQEYVREILQDTALNIHFLDDWKYHTWAGNVHCATNTKRKRFSKNWWE